MKTSIRMASGLMFDVYHPRPEDFTPEDMARGLAGMPRFGAQTYKPYSVAEHSLRISALCSKENKLAALVHDGAEGLGLMDMPAPIKHSGLLRGYRMLHRRVNKMLCKKFGLRSIKPPEVASMDKAILVIEQRDLQGKVVKKKSAKRALKKFPRGYYIGTTMPKAKAEYEWLREFYRLIVKERNGKKQK